MAWLVGEYQPGRGGHTDNPMVKRYCERCSREVIVKLVRNITQNGDNQIYWYCISGEHSTKKNGNFIKHQQVIDAGLNPDTLPVIENYSGMELCAVCQSPFTELHHFAPRHLFGDDCEKWPKAYLCKTHHNQWHNLVTPDMSKPRPQCPQSIKSPFLKSN